jgi:tellurite resistance protein TerA
MTVALVQGGNAAVGAGRIQVAVSWTPPAPVGMDIDVSAFLLTATGKVRSDDDMVFYNQKQSSDGAVVLLADPAAAGGRDETVFALDLARLSTDIQKIAFTVTVDEGQARGQALGRLQTLVARVVDAESRQELLRFEQPVAGASEVAMTLAELYQRNGQWKLRAVAQGFAGGLAPLARSYGVSVADTPPAAALPPVVPPAPVVPPPPAPPPPKISLSKITLEKKGQSVSLEKRTGGYGQIRVNLNWSRGAPARAGGLSGLFGGRSKGVDLDLGCFIELNDGFRTVVQALGNRFGSLSNEPFVELSGDDRTGAVSEGENLLINGDHWDRIRRILVFAFIYEGVPNWNATDGVVTVYAKDQPPLEVRLTDGHNDRGLCAIALLENERGALKVSKLAEYFQDHQDMDQRYGWGFRWTAGSKD